MIPCLGNLDLKVRNSHSHYVEQQLESVVHTKLLMAVEEREPVHLRVTSTSTFQKPFTSTTSFRTPDVGLPFTFVSSKLLRCKWIG